MVFKPFGISNTPHTVWEWCKDIWYSNSSPASVPINAFENDVKIYGIQTEALLSASRSKFENDVKIYGIQTKSSI